MMFVIYILAALLMLLFSGLKIMKEYERAVVLRLGRLVNHRGPGIIYVIPGIEKMVRVDMRTITMDIPTQDVITRDNVSAKVNAVVYFRVIDPSRAVVEVENYLYATSQLAQTTMRSVCGLADLDDLLSERERVNQQIQTILDEQTDPWGIKVVSVEVKHIDLPQEMQRAMARQAEAERDRRAKVIHAQGEFEASARLTEAAAKMAEHPVALQLRFLQTLGELSSENSSTIVLPLPIDLISPMIDGLRHSNDAAARATLAATQPSATPSAGGASSTGSSSAAEAPAPEK